jgi:hypothetical protein
MRVFPGLNEELRAPTSALGIATDCDNNLNRRGRPTVLLRGHRGVNLWSHGDP